MLFRSRAHTEHLPEALASQGVQQEVAAAVGEQVLGVTLLVLQRTQQRAGSLQLGVCDVISGRLVADVGASFLRHQQEVTLLAQPSLVLAQGFEHLEPEGGGEMNKNNS